MYRRIQSINRRIQSINRQIRSMYRRIRSINRQIRSINHKITFYIRYIERCIEWYMDLCIAMYQDLFCLPFLQAEGYFLRVNIYELLSDGLRQNES